MLKRTPVGEDTLLPLKVTGVYSHQEQNKSVRHFARLYDILHRRQLYLWVGDFEAWSIAAALESEPSPSPNTHPTFRISPLSHDLILTLLQSCGAVLEKVCINDRNGTAGDEAFYALAYLRVGETIHEIDLRPSDALALALRAKCPIYIKEAVMAAAGRPV